MNQVYLQAKLQEWQTLQTILTIESPESRWQLLQIWLSNNGDWQTLINKILATPDNDACFQLILDAIGLPASMLNLFDRDRKIRDAAAKYIGIIRALYLERIAPPRQLK